MVDSMVLDCQDTLTSNSPFHHGAYPFQSPEVMRATARTGCARCVSGTSERPVVVPDQEMALELEDVD